MTFGALLLHTHPLGVTTRVIATKLSGVNQPSFAGMLGWSLQLKWLDQRGQEHVVFFCFFRKQPGPGRFTGTIALLIETMKGRFAISIVESNYMACDILTVTAWHSRSYPQLLRS